MHVTRGTSTIQQPRHPQSDLSTSTAIGDVAAKHADVYSARLAQSYPVDRTEEGKGDLKDSSIIGSTSRTTVGSAQTRLSEYCSANSRLVKRCPKLTHCRILTYEMNRWIFHGNRKKSLMGGGL
ncbi:hypothetical protein FBUS_07438 [Fasciolopsis buskii]|uniref:Uncharacterized protein n=1 Tax=Fasciolopsis buskii TaxID=27845 RepID=A0A8E0S6L9_9TREM|nr:hypothetical protein FBUS_07438 [Fasciolopsis buski]